MALSSQSARSRVGERGNSSQPAASRKPIWIGSAVAAVLVLSGIFIIPMFFGGGDSSPGGEASRGAGDAKSVGEMSGDTDKSSRPGESTGVAGELPMLAATTRGAQAKPALPEAPTVTLGGRAPVAASPTAVLEGPSRTIEASPTAFLPEADANKAPAPVAADQSVAVDVDFGDGALGEAMQLVEAGHLVKARAQLSLLLLASNSPLTIQQAQAVRATLTRINEDLIFSPRMVPGDPLVEPYRVSSGEFLGTIARKYDVPWRLLERINNIKANRLRAGSTIKVVRGPFHAVVRKGDYRMDIHIKDPTTDHPIYVRSFDVGLGENDSTPTGLFAVDRGRKLINPPWTNPRTGEFFAADDADNPIGERWIGLSGAAPQTLGVKGYGIHGTIDPQSIGQQKSMGCVRLLDDDVRLVYDLLEEGKSVVDIRVR